MSTDLVTLAQRVMDADKAFAEAAEAMKSAHAALITAREELRRATMVNTERRGAPGVPRRKGQVLDPAMDVLRARGVPLTCREIATGVFGEAGRRNVLKISNAMVYASARGQIVRVMRPDGVCVHSLPTEESAR